MTQAHIWDAGWKEDIRLNAGLLLNNIFMTLSETASPPNMSVGKEQEDFKTQEQLFIVSPVISIQCQPL